MRFVSSDEEVGLSREGTFEDAVVIILGGDNGDPLCGLDDPHERGGLFTDRMDESIHIFLRPNPERLSLQSCLPLKLPPPLFLEVQAQGLPHQLTLGSVFFLGCTLSLSDKLGGK
jgi:hypothetical protein